MELAKVNLGILTDRVNKRLRMAYDYSYMSKVRGGSGGSPSLRDICRQEEAKIFREAADAVESVS